MLDDDAIARYARQIVVPGIGAAGQEKLLNSTVLVVGHPRGCRAASLYLRAAGVQVANDSLHPQAVVLADMSSVERDVLEWAVTKKAPVCWYDADENGFDYGVHPAAPFPSVSGERAPVGSAVHDAAACAAAAAACSLILSLENPGTPLRIDISR